MPTIAGLKRRGVPPAAVREFVKRIGVAKANSVVDVGMLEFCIREELNKHRAAPHGGAAAAQGRDRELSGRPGRGARRPSTIPTIPTPAPAASRSAASSISSSDDFMENPPKKFFRLSPGNEVRLRYAYFIKCTERHQERGRRGRRAALHLRSRNQGRQRARRPQGQGDHALAAGGAVGAGRNPRLQSSCSQTQSRRRQFRRRHQSAVAGSPVGRAGRAGGRREPIRSRSMQFERQGYFVRDKDSTPDRPVFNRTIGLRDTFAKEVGRG